MILIDSARSALSLVQIGNYQDAIDSLGGKWRGVGVEPVREDETDVEYGHLLLACGALSVGLGAMAQTPIQASKDMLSRSVRLLGNDPSAQEARLWLGNAYRWCDESHEAIALMDDLLEEQTADSNIVFQALSTKAVSQMALGDCDGAMRTLREMEPLLLIAPPLSVGKFYLNRGILRRMTGEYEEALIDYHAAGVAFQEAGSCRYEAAVENNCAGVYMDQGRLVNARAAAERAAGLFRALGDRAHEGKALDQLAQIAGRSGDFDVMASMSRRAITILSSGDNEGWLAEALTTHGVACGRLGLSRAQEHLSRALTICDRQGDSKRADQVTRLMWDVVLQAKRVVDELHAVISPLERSIFERLLEKHDGRISPVADELGLSHQAVQRKLNNHFPDLLAKRRQPWRRRKTVTTK